MARRRWCAGCWRDEILNQDQRECFAREGYVVVRQAADPGRLDAARAEIALRLKLAPPPAGHVGPWSEFVPAPIPTALNDLLYRTQVIEQAQALIGGKFEPPDHVQVALVIPPWKHRPGGPHVDGLNPPEASGRPGTFTLLAGIFLTDQSAPDSGNLWVWPGSHLSAAQYLRANGPDALLKCSPYPPVELSTPKPVLGSAGDLLLAHYLLGHNMGGNITPVTRQVVYFRLHKECHRDHWRECVQDPLLEFGMQAS